MTHGQCSRMGLHKPCSWAKCSPLSVLVNKVSRKHNPAHSSHIIVHCCTPARAENIVEIELIGPPKLEIFALWPFIGKSH